MAALAFLLPLAFGWLTARALLGELRPRWALEMLTAGLAVGFGAGYASATMFLMRWAGAATPIALTGVDIVAVGLGALLFARRDKQPLENELPPFPWIWVAWAAFGITVMFCLVGFAAAWNNNPHGDFDAFSIWNLRAKWLASAEGWRFAVIPRIELEMWGATHTGYPLLLTGWVAHAWVLAGTTAAGVPMTVALLFTLGVAALLAGTLAVARSATVGLMAGALVLGADSFLVQGPKMYADVPVTFYMLGALALAALAYLREWNPRLLLLAGACAGLSFWTKNEGAPFVLALAGVLAWLLRGRVLPFLWGSLPGLAVTLAFRVGVAPPDKEIAVPHTLAGIMEKLAVPSRWWESLLGLAQMDWVFPIVMVVAAAWVLKGNRQDAGRAVRWLAIPVLVMLAADYAAFVLTTNDLKWHIGTAAPRLLAQLWPPALFVALWAMGRPEDFAEAIPVKGGKKAR